MPEPVYPGGCLCGAVRYEAPGPASNLCYCHCDSCRRATGVPAVPWVTFARAGFRLSRGALAEYRSSAQVVRGFCAACGTSLTYRNELRPAEIDVTLATLDDPAPLAPAAHIWVADKLPWVSVADGLPVHARGFGGA